MMLEALGYNVLAASNPNEAIKMTGEYAGDINLVLTDVVMPEMSGRDLQKRISAVRSDMKYLFMSGYTANVIAHRGILDEDVNFLQKPFHMVDLAARMREALRKG
jgi:DNA-binding NtrC family response regulator